MKNTLEFIKRYAIIILTVGLFICLLIAVATAQTPASHNPGSAPASVARAKEEVKKSPSPASWFHLGYAQLKAGDREQAGASFEQGLRLDDREPLLLCGKGYLAMQNNDSVKAKEFFDKALLLSKFKNTGVLKIIAEGYLLNPSTVSEAVALLEKAKAIDDSDPAIEVLLGDAFFSQNNGGLAITSYEHAAKLDPGSTLPHFKIGLVYERSKNYTAAEEAFRKALQIDSAYALVYKELGELFYLRKEAEKALANYEKYFSLAENPEEGKLQYAFILFMAKKYTEANEQFREVVPKNPTPTTLRYYAQSLFEAGDYSTSNSLFNEYFKKSKPEERSAMDHAYYGKVLLKLHEDSLAVGQFREGLTLDATQKETWQLLAETLLRNKKYSEAIKAYQSLMALRQKPVTQDYYSIGRAYYYKKEYEQAEAAFKKVSELQPDMVTGYLWHARAQSNLDPESENGLAKPSYEKVIEIASHDPAKNKNDLIEACSYLGYYHFLKQEKTISKSYWDKVLEIDPENVKAKEALKVTQ